MNSGGCPGLDISTQSGMQPKAGRNPVAIWWCIQSRANFSLPPIPVNKEISRQFQQIRPAAARFSGTKAGATDFSRGSWPRVIREAQQGKGLQEQGIRGTAQLVTTFGPPVLGRLVPSRVSGEVRLKFDVQI